jgi:hypothetical protein
MMGNEVVGRVAGAYGSVHRRRARASEGVHRVRPRRATAAAAGTTMSTKYQSTGWQAPRTAKKSAHVDKAPIPRFFMESWRVWR